jgi:hypothetical protein
VFRDVLHSVGGVSALFPLFLQLNARVHVHSGPLVERDPNRRSFSFQPAAGAAPATAASAQPRASSAAPAAGAKAATASAAGGRPTPSGPTEDPSEFVLTNGVVDPKLLSSLLRLIGLFVVDTPVNRRFMSQRKGFGLIAYQLERAPAAYFTNETVKILEAILETTVADKVVFRVCATPPHAHPRTHLSDNASPCPLLCRKCGTRFG